MNKMQNLAACISLLALCISVLAITISKSSPKIDIAAEVEQYASLKTPLQHDIILRGVVEKAEDIGAGLVRVTILDDADCTHNLVLNGSADQLYIDEYNRIITSHTTNRTWGSIEEVFMGED